MVQGQIEQGIMSAKVSRALRTSDDLLICNECGTQYGVTANSGKDDCKICDDPRQYVPAGGQVFTTLGRLQKQGHRNEWWQAWSAKTYPSVGHFQQQSMRATDCPVYVGDPDKIWLERVVSPGADIRFLTETYTDILSGSGTTAILAGGNCSGSLLLHWEKTLFIADTIFMSASAMNPVPGKDGVISFTFFWSIPNRIPLHPDDMVKIWRMVKTLDFDTCMPGRLQRARRVHTGQ
ncbi:hypothetical protein AC579_6174 [Pseudocercospora musae]|uniref:Uncharacterized protein n=1 Tax=Pseudocercospora musae TaxID=113226 RepID=A0A139IS21_9PEZI|nr:hypothetical protein AC579_6174 [Pseudocercospora musae]